MKSLPIITCLILLPFNISYADFNNPNNNNKVKNERALMAINGNESELIMQKKTNSVKEAIKLKLDKFYANEDNYKSDNYELKEETSDWMAFSKPYDCTQWESFSNDKKRTCKIKEAQSYRGYMFDPDRKYVKDIDILVTEREGTIVQYYSQTAPDSLNSRGSHNFSQPYSKDIILKEEETKKDIKPINILFGVEPEVLQNSYTKVLWATENADFCSIDLGLYGKFNGINGFKDVKITHVGELKFTINCKNSSGGFESYYALIKSIDPNADKDSIDGWIDVPNEIIKDKNYIVYWSFNNNADKCSISFNDRELSNEIKGYAHIQSDIIGTSKFKAECKNNVHTYTRSRYIAVNDKNSNINIQLNTPKEVKENESFRISWKATNADYCNVSFSNIYKSRLSSTDSISLTYNDSDFKENLKLQCFNNKNMQTKTETIQILKDSL